MVLTGWHIAHILALGAWGGLVAGEMVIEIASLKAQRLQYAVAKYHQLIDKFVEIPLLVAVLISGAILATQTNMSSYLAVKIAFGLAAVLVNFVCVVVVIQRRNVAEDDDSIEALSTLTRLIFVSAIVGLPFAAAALWMGGTSVAWW